ncbi:hypothetical protein [Roseibium sp.]|uniref:hypothetical protein n=1 Tax=Roseibium sp. TaxID=1936156 RepID=UPI003A96CC1D
MFTSEIYVPQAKTPANTDLEYLKAEVDKHNLNDMWNMILLLDYQVANVHELSPETREEFCGIVSLLLKAFTK